jgi:hypothetical protein
MKYRVLKNTKAGGLMLFSHLRRRFTYGMALQGASTDSSRLSIHDSSHTILFRHPNKITLHIVVVM